MRGDALPTTWIDSESGASPLLLPAFLGALLLHGLFFFWLHMQPPPAPEPLLNAHQTLDVIILRQAAPREPPPEKVDAYAQVNRQGSGDEKPAEQRPEPAPEPEKVQPEPLEEQPPPLPPEAPPPLLAVPSVEPPLALQAEPVPEAPPAPSAAQILASRSLEIAKLRAKILSDSLHYASRQRRRAINASTKEYKYASYLEAWRRKVERVGNLNYPEEAKQRKLYGSLILHVALRADGSIETLRILRSSGSDILDQAAIRIVELAAPFAPFPPAIRKETDILDITRTWQFLSNNRLGWKN